MKNTIKNKANLEYKQTAIGLIPVDWEVKRLGEIFIFKNGLNKEKEFFGKGTPIVNYMDVFRNHYLDSSILKGRVTVFENELRNFEVKKGDVFFTRTSETIEEIGMSSVVIEEVENTVFSGFVLRARPFSNCLDIRYNIYCFSSENVRKEITTKSTITTRALTNGTLLSAVQLPIPPLPEQQKIASILSTWDAAIDNCKAIIEKLKERNKGLAQKLLSGKKRVKGFEKTKWVEKKADKIFKSHTDKTHNGDLEILSATQDRGVIPRSMSNYDIVYDINSLGTYKKVEVGDYVISLRSFQGGIEFSEYEGIVSPAYTILKELIPISKKFYKVYFKTETFINRLNTIIYGIRDGKQISFGDFATLNVPYPTIEEQNKIANILDVTTTELTHYQQKLQALQLQKKGLMQQLLTGKVRVRV